MDMVNKWIVTYVILELCLIWGCAFSSDEDCALPLGSKAVIGDMTIRNIQFNHQQSIIVLSENDTINFDAYALWLDITPDYVSHFSSGFKGGMPGRLYACNFENNAELTEVFTNITVTTLFDIEADTLQAGSNVTSFFEVIMPSGNIPLDDIDAVNEILRKEIYLFIKPKAALRKEMAARFEISVNTIFNKSFDLQTDLIYLKE